MTSQTLEQTIELVPRTGRLGTSHTIDVYDIGTVALYTPPPERFAFGGPTSFDSIGGPSSFLKPFQPLTPQLIPIPDYSVCTKPNEPIGLVDPQPFQYGYDLNGGYQVHMHGPDKNTITFGSVEHNNKPIKSFNGYESAIIDLTLAGKFKKFP